MAVKRVRFKFSLTSFFQFWLEPPPRNLEKHFLTGYFKVNKCPLLAGNVKLKTVFTTGKKKTSEHP